MAMPDPRASSEEIGRRGEELYERDIRARVEADDRNIGKIIVIGSIQSELPVSKSAAYNMAKAAINHLVATMAGELAPYHININVINPGWIDTPGEREFATEEELRQGARRIPWGRLGTPRDIGRCAVFLASNDADYITGTRIRVDGGYMSGLALADRGQIG